MNNSNTPQKLAGFRDFFACDIAIRDYVMGVFKKVFEKYGYEPLETPALESAELFVGNLGEEAEKLFYRFNDNGDRDIMLKYEVMISMCRAVAENLDSIPLPYKRYQIQKVWRAEKPQKGRYREFTQCDADTIGSNSVLCDAEFIQMGIEALQTLGFNDFVAEISNRKFLNGIVQYSGARESDFIPICLSIDKLPKIGAKAVKEELINKRGVNNTIADKILSIATLEGESRQLLTQLKETLKDIPLALEGLDELKSIFTYLESAGVDPKYYTFAPFIARGLAYYTGPIWEFEIKEGGVGSVAGCGRYDTVLERFTGRKIPATGGSFGLERIIEVLKDRGMVSLPETTTKVLVTVFDESGLNESIQIATKLRDSGISTLLYPEKDSLGRQIKYASLKKIPYVIVAGPDEIEKGIITVKAMESGSQSQQTLSDFINTQTTSR